jgi:predicted choloylglycine hydrolase
MPDRKTSFFRKKLIFISFMLISLLGIVLACAYYFRTPIILYFTAEKACPVITVSGTWEEMGYQLGSRPDFAGRIHRLTPMFAKTCPYEKALAYYSRIKLLIPESILEQMKGLARGEAKVLDIPFDEAWKEILVWNFFITSTYMRGCTAFAVSSEKGAFLAHNTDLEYLYALGGAVIVFKPSPGNGYSFVSFYQPAFTGVALGENSEGLAVVFNAAFPGNRDYGLPPEMLARKILQECSTLEDAVAVFKSFLTQGGRFAHNGANFTFMDFKSRRMARVEVAPDRIEVDYGTTRNSKTFIVATNHYRLMPERNDRDDFNTSSYARYERCTMLLDMARDISLPGVLTILSDHDEKACGTDHTICRHKNLNVGTNSFLAFDDKFILSYILGNPCRYRNNPSLLQRVSWKESAGLQ